MIEGRLLPTNKDYQVVTTRLYWESTPLIWYFENSNYNNAYEKELFTDSKRKKATQKEIKDFQAIVRSIMFAMLKHN